MNERVPNPKAARAAVVILFTCAALLAYGCLSPNDPLDPQVLASISEVDCDTLNLTYENFGRAFFEKYCLRCHSASLTDDLARSDAPLGIDFDSLEDIRSYTTRTALRAGELGDMPPALLGGQQPSVAERIQLLQWIECGTPSEADATTP